MTAKNAGALKIQRSISFILWIVITNQALTNTPSFTVTPVSLNARALERQLRNGNEDKTMVNLNFRVQLMAIDQLPVQVVSCVESEEEMTNIVVWTGRLQAIQSKQVSSPLCGELLLRLTPTRRSEGFRRQNRLTAHRHHQGQGRHSFIYFP